MSSSTRLKPNFARGRLALRDRVPFLSGKGYRASVFTRIDEKNLWGEQGSVSGPGSIAVATARVATQLPEIWREYGHKIPGGCPVRRLQLDVEYRSPP